ncbi:type II secretion system F family protein [Oryzibacter oryziterrae]|uniref:type II secretion system F family protein n=1 Tax=Oryzibacter oryziterrae TaxID=2766474 RepID=UPI001F26FDE1|nr:type II secretion system F family protein [Oryzibacter oryziterrae]
MARFTYIALTAGQEQREGTIEAASEADAARELGQTGLTVLKLQTARAQGTLRGLLAKEVRLSSGLRPKEFLSLVQEWATLAGAGLNLHTLLDLSAKGRKGALGALVAKLRDDVRKGRSFQQALAESGQFPADFVALVGAGEASGALDQSLKEVAETARTRLQLAQRLKKELIYPAFLSVTASAAIVVLLTIVVPNIEQLIDDAGQVTLPLVTRAVIAASHLLRDYGLMFIAILATTTAAMAALWHSTPGRRALSHQVLSLPLIGPVLASQQLSRYLQTLASLVGGGVSLARAQGYAAETVTNAHMRLRLAGISTALAEGRMLHMSLEDTGLIAEDALGLIRSGEQTGRLDAMLRAAGLLLQARGDQRLEVLAAMLGPIMTIVFGLIAGLIVYAMLTTILSINEFAFR